MTIRTIYHGDAPKFPATDQHPQAKRYGPLQLSGGRSVYVDAVGGEPTAADIEAVLKPSARTLDQKLAAAGLTKEDIKAAIA